MISLGLISRQDLEKLAGQGNPAQVRVGPTGRFSNAKARIPLPRVHQETWDQLVKSYVEALEILKEQAVKEAQIPKKEEPPWMRKSSSSGLFESF